MFLPKTKNKVLLPSAIPTIFESIHEPEISITTGPPVKRKRQRKAVKPPIIENDFEYDEDLPLSALSTLLPPKLSMKKKLVKSKANTASSWTYRPSVPITRDGNNDDVQSSGTEEEYEECDLEDADPNDPNFDASAPKRVINFCLFFHLTINCFLIFNHTISKSLTMRETATCVLVDPAFSDERKGRVYLSSNQRNQIT